MWHKSVFTILYVCLVFSPDVQGSCLEYGHSCWGAHGKRSSGQAIDDKNTARESTLRNLRDNQLNGVGADNANRIAANKYDIDEALTSAESSPHRTLNTEDFADDSNDPTKLRAYTRQRYPKFTAHSSQSDNNNTPPIDNINREGNADSREEHRRQRQKQQQQPRRYPQHVQRWRKLPIFGLRRTFSNSPLALVEAAPLELPARNEENDLLQQIGQLATERRLDDIATYYDMP